jgi:hypothetical protein
MGSQDYQVGQVWSGRRGPDRKIVGVHFGGNEIAYVRRYKDGWHHETRFCWITTWESWVAGRVAE